ncbi:LOW QUALITY PROTEIN: putative gustatory receptor 28b [Vespula squamosa]|uniref:Gustatory receptor 28b n=1 Tax=Vespula squamosa TaxID=30214 RepID=A0ABD2AY02_VESSQ
MIEFIVIIEFFTIVSFKNYILHFYYKLKIKIFYNFRCIKLEFRRANELLSDVNVLPISSIALELLEHKETDGSLSIERSLPVDSKKIFIAQSSLCQAQLRLQVASHKINKNRRLLRTIRQVHLELYRISKNYSSMYGIQISLEMALSVLSNTYLSYNIYVQLNKIEDTNDLILQLIIFILCCLQYMLKIFAINYICDRTTREAERTSEIIHTFYGQSMDFEIKKEVEIFSLQMMQCRTAYTASGLYNFNCKHICSVVCRYYNNIHRYHDTSQQFNRTRIIDHCEFQRSIRPLIIANSIVCTGLLEYFGRPIRTMGLVYTICLLICYITLFFGFIDIINIFMETQTTKMAEIISRFYCFLNTFLFIVTIFAGFVRRKKMQLFVEQLVTCTRGFDELNISTNYYSLFWYQCIAGTILIFIILGTILFNVIWFSKINCDYGLKLWFHFYDIYPLIVTMINDLTFVFWIRQIKFSQLNAVLQSMLTTTIDSPQHNRVFQMKDNWEHDSSLSTIYRTYKAHENLMKLKRIRQIHLELIKCARIINEAYGLQIFVSMSTSVVFITALLYQIYSTLITEEFVLTWTKGIYIYFYWIFYYAFKILFVNNICETTMTEMLIVVYIDFPYLLYVLYTGDILYELYEPSTRKKFRDEILNFLYQLIQNPLIFTCGFYDIGHTFLYIKNAFFLRLFYFSCYQDLISTIGSIINYLVVLIEFGEIPKVLSNNMNYNSSSMIDIYNYKIKKLFKMFQSKEFQKSVMPLIIANSIFCTGLLEYFVDRTVRTIGFFYTICCLIYYSTLYFILKDVMNTLLGYKKTNAAGILSKFTFVNNVFIYVITIFAGFLKRKQIISFLQQLETLHRCLNIIFSGLIAGNIFWTFKANCDYSLKIWFYFYDSYPLIVTMINDFTFVFWIRQIKFSQLNAVLQNMLTTTIDSPQHKRVLRMKDNWEHDSSLSTIYRTYKAHENLMKLKRIRQIHLEMIKCASIINEAYGLQILLSMFTSIIYIISLLYNFYVISITNEYNGWINEFFAHFYWIFFFIMKIITVNNTCETTITENTCILIFLIFLYALNSGDLLHELYEPSISKKFRDEVRIHKYQYLILVYLILIHNFIFQQVHNRLTFAACRLFNLGHTFIYSAIGLITTYLVIFIQTTKLHAKRINEIDKTLQTLGSSASFNNIYERTIMEIMIAILYLFCFCTIMIVDWILKDQDIYKSFLIYYAIFLHIYSFMVKFISVFEFFTIIRCIKSEFQRANELLSDINVLPISSIASELIEHKEADGSLSIERSLPVDSKKLFIALPSLRQTQSQIQVASIRVNRSRTLLRTIRQVHLELYKISRSFSNIYGIQISLEMAICILLNTYMLYCLYEKYQEEIVNITEVILQFIITMLLCLQYSIKIFGVNYICDKTTKEAEHTNEIIHTFYGQTTDYEIRREVEIFSLQMMQRPIAYSAFGLYNLNCKYVCSCVGVITTYIIIMIQFLKVEENKIVDITLNSITFCFTSFLFTCSVSIKRITSIQLIISY